MTLRAVEAREPGRGGERLAEIAEVLEGTGWAFELLDASWRVVRFSDQLKLVIGEDDDEALGVGRHVIETRMMPAWQGVIDQESERCWVETNLPYILSADPGALRHVAPGHHAQSVVARAAEAPATWTFGVSFVQRDGTYTRAHCLGMALREGGGTLGYALLYGPALPASLLALVVRGDEGLFRRMAQLVEPRRTEAAILFADVEASAALSRRLPSRAFFQYICALTSAFDREVLARRGIVGKHAGDGVTAFFLADDLGSPAAAARAAIEAARAMERASAEAASAVPAVGRVLAAGGGGLNAGLHWGAGLYMGQLVTGGRLEVTALGDEVNECARIEQSARGGAVLASKALLERLDDDAAAALGIDVGGVVYRTVADLEGAGEKAVRDAGGIPVADIGGRTSAA